MLRPYQQKAHEDVIRGLKHTKNNLICCIATAGGKSHNIAALAEWVASFDGYRCAIITNRKELLLQNLSKINHKSVGIVSAGLNRFEYDKQIVLGGIQTIYNKQDKLGNINLIIVDECHALSNSKKDSMYWDFINSYPDARLVGYTATPFRLNEGLLNWGKIIHNTTYEDLLEQGYVTPLTNKVSYNPDLSKVRKQSGEYVMSDYYQKELHDNLPEVINKVIEAAQTRNKVLGFMPSVEAVNQALFLMRAVHKLDVEAVTGKTPKQEREEILDRYNNGNLKYLLNVDVLTTGFDNPAIDLIFCCRPTQSLALFHQIQGRGVRLHESKKNCLIMDFAGNLKAHGSMIDDSWKYMGSNQHKQKKQINKVCPACEELIPITAKECPECHYVPITEEQKETWFEPEPDIETDMSEKRNPIKWFTINRIEYLDDWVSSKGNKMLKVKYFVNGFQYFAEYVPGWKRKQWFAKRGNREFKDLIKPKRIQVNIASKYNDIINFEW